MKSASDSEKPLLGKNEKPIIRPYTPTSSSDLEGELHFLIKRYDEGKMSQHIHSLQPGEKLAIKGPIMKIPYKGPPSSLLTSIPADAYTHQQTSGRKSE